MNFLCMIYDSLYTTKTFKKFFVAIYVHCLQRMQKKIDLKKKNVNKN